jgi:glucosamine-phosphate N-acetyltransferase
VAVHKDHQGKGVGKALLQKLVEDAKTHFGCYKVILDCTPDLTPFYEKNGFQQVGVCMRMTL